MRNLCVISETVGLLLAYLWLHRTVFSSTVFNKTERYVRDLIWVENVLKSRTRCLKLKIFSFCSNQFELAVFSLYISTN